MFNKIEYIDDALKKLKLDKTKEIKEILKNNPELLKVIKEAEKTQKNADILVEENIEQHEEIERLKRELSLQQTSDDKDRKENPILKQKIESLTKKLEEAFKINSNCVKAYKELDTKYNEIKDKRGILGTIKDKAIIMSYAHENAELLARLSFVGRPKVTKYQIDQIINYYQQGLGYSKIADKTNVSKSTVSKYVQRYLKGTLKAPKGGL